MKKIIPLLLGVFVATPLLAMGESVIPQGEPVAVVVDEVSRAVIEDVVQGLSMLFESELADKGLKPTRFRKDTLDAVSVDEIPYIWGFSIVWMGTKYMVSASLVDRKTGEVISSSRAFSTGNDFPQVAERLVSAVLYERRVEEVIEEGSVMEEEMLPPIRKAPSTRSEAGVILGSITDHGLIKGLWGGFSGTVSQFIFYGKGDVWYGDRTSGISLLVGFGMGKKGFFGGGGIGIGSLYLGGDLYAPAIIEGVGRWYILPYASMSMMVEAGLRSYILEGGEQYVWSVFFSLGLGIGAGTDCCLR
mgnify:CR=1 FL=1